jgi:two-component system, NarL family, nitrate/nitrite response regulator NarL
MPKMKKVLVAEDEPSLAEFIVILLNHWNCETEVVHNGKEAVSRAATLRPHVALLGVVMPVMGGIEAAIELQKVSPDTKPVLITETVPNEALLSLRSQGYNFATFPAPFGCEELREVIFGGLGGAG